MISTKTALTSLGLTLAAATPAMADGFLTPSTEVSVGAGVATFTDDGQRSFTGTAGTWDARVAFGFHFPITLEAAYIGSAQSLDRLGLSDDAVLLSNGAEAVARVNLLPGPITPYLHAGAAWRRYTIENSDRNLSDLIAQDDVLEVPFGLGADLNVGPLVIDGRVTYRAAFDDDLVQTGDIDDVDDRDGMNTVGARIAVGMVF